MIAATLFAILGAHAPTARDGLDALKLLKGPACIDVLFIDVVMPCMNGIALAAKARKLAPAMKLSWNRATRRR